MILISKMEIMMMFLGSHVMVRWRWLFTSEAAEILVLRNQMYLMMEKMTLSKLSILMKTPEASVPGWLGGTGVFDAATEAEPKVSVEDFLENLLGTKSDEIRKKRGRMFIS